MAGLLALSGAIDRVNEFIGKWVSWLILASILVSAGNAVVRKVFNIARTPGSSCSGICSAPPSCWPPATR